MLVGRRQDLGHSPAQPMAITFLLLLNFPYAGTETQPLNSGLTPSNSLENRGALSEPGVEEKSLLLVEDQGSGDRQIQAPIPAQPPWKLSALG